jgi:MFS family permease
MRRYGAVITDRRLRVLLPGLAFSYVGDGFSAVAVPWLALQLAPPGRTGWWVGLAIAAYTLPGALGGFAFAPLMRRLSTVRVAESAALLRATALSVIVCLGVADLLNPALYVGLLAGSSLLYTWGVSAQYTFVAETLPAEHRLSANSLFYSLANVGLIVGAAVSGVVADTIGPLVGVGVDAISFAVLAATYRFGVSRRHAQAAAGPHRSAGRVAGVRTILRNRVLLAMVAVTFGYYLASGPIQAALPLFITGELGASSRLLGTLWAVSSAGAVAGALLFGLLAQPPLWLTAVLVIVASSGMSLVLGSATTVAVCVLGFTLSRVAFSPYPALSYTLMQSHSPPGTLAEVLAARGALILVAPPLGTALGGPLVDAVGPRPTILMSGGTTLTLGAAVGVVLAVRARNRAVSRS